MPRARLPVLGARRAFEGRCAFERLDLAGPAGARRRSSSRARAAAAASSEEERDAWRRYHHVSTTRSTSRRRFEPLAERVERVALDRACALLRDVEHLGDRGELLRVAAEPEWLLTSSRCLLGKVAPASSTSRASSCSTVSSTGVASRAAPIIVSSGEPSLRVGCSSDTGGVPTQRVAAIPGGGAEAGQGRRPRRARALGRLHPSGRPLRDRSRGRA